ncbi:hypothetical protein SMC1_01130 [Candidatus Cryosericum septentrionale]|uniref:DUF5667 domain-containing protein n=1 Tax=Candidatus Cryosericum septentrionale TaxID=2290913 RepID=A0A398E1U3_9BACT|nr:hypothetical protein SMC1_01130 [Candidatus Cryosericum septentrionale]
MISCLIVGLLCCSLLAPVASAASTFTADLDLYRTHNKTTSDAAHELAAYVTAELLFARSVKGTMPQYRLLARTYLTALDQVNSATRRVARDQHTSDRLLADVLALTAEKHVEAAWILLKRGTAGQERFLTTITRTGLLVARCNVLHAQLTGMGGKEGLTGMGGKEDRCSASFRALLRLD